MDPWKTLLDKIRKYFDHLVCEVRGWPEGSEEQGKVVPAGTKFSLLSCYYATPHALVCIA